MSDAEVDLDRSWVAFSRLVDRAAGELQRGRLERSAVAAQVAATYAWFNHPGVFASQALEDVVQELGRRLPSVPAPHRAPEPAQPRLLHVATEVYGTGGHTQMLANWITLDTGREHDLCLTSQRGRPVPAKLLCALAGRGTVTLLDDQDDHLLDRARSLRELTARVSTVVLHGHPNDVIPGIALAADGRRARVLTVNHADHVFWVGTRTPDLLLNLRRSGAELSATRRGVPPDRMGTLIRPLTLHPRRLSRECAREQLGVAEGQRLLVTAAAGSKYISADGAGFLDLVMPVLRADPRATLIAAGPSASGEWAALEAAGLGRSLGLLPDIRPLLEAADVYLDSFPFSSLTSMLEAAGLGLPVLTLRPPGDEPGVLGADTPELEEAMVVAPSPADFQAALRRLLDDPAGRAEVGARTGAAVQAAHADGAWQRAARQVTETARPRRATTAAVTDVRRTGALDRKVAVLQRETGWGQGVVGATGLNAPLLPLHHRLAWAARLLVARRRPRVSQLLSARTARRLRALRLRAGQQGQGPRV